MRSLRPEAGVGIDPVDRRNGSLFIRMCGRYYRTADKQAIAEYFRSDPGDELILPPAYNVAPTTTQPIIRQSRDTGAREIVGLRWGLVGFGGSGPDPKRSTFNARVENLAKSPLWRTPLHKRRCLVPISGFTSGGRPTKPRSASPWRATHVCSRRPLGRLEESKDWRLAPELFHRHCGGSPAMQGIHSRMPAILQARDYDEWLDRGEAERPPIHLLRPYEAPPSGPHITVTPANPKVGNVRNQDIDLLDSQ